MNCSALTQTLSPLSEIHIKSVNKLNLRFVQYAGVIYVLHLWVYWYIVQLFQSILTNKKAIGNTGCKHNTKK